MSLHFPQNPKTKQEWQQAAEDLFIELNELQRRLAEYQQARLLFFAKLAKVELVNEKLYDALVAMVDFFALHDLIKLDVGATLEKAKKALSVPPADDQTIALAGALQRIDDLEQRLSLGDNRKAECGHLFRYQVSDSINGNYCAICKMNSK